MISRFPACGVNVRQSTQNLVAYCSNVAESTRKDGLSDSLPSVWDWILQENRTRLAWPLGAGALE